MAPDGSNQRKLFDRMGTYRHIDMAFDVSPVGEVVWSRTWRDATNCGRRWRGGDVQRSSTT
jgi:hypothetical protein